MRTRKVWSGSPTPIPPEIREALADALADALVQDALDSGRSVLYSTPDARDQKIREEAPPLTDAGQAAGRVKGGRDELPTAPSPPPASRSGGPVAKLDLRGSRPRRARRVARAPRRRAS